MRSRAVTGRRSASDAGPIPATGTAAYLAVVLTVTLLGAAGALPRWPGLLHLVALPPLDLAADLRWLLARATGYPSFVGGLVAVVVVRTAVLALLLGGIRRPRWRLAASIYLAAGIPLLLAAQFDFIAHAAMYSRLFGAGLVVVAIVVMVLAAAVWTGRPQLGAAIRDSARNGLRASELVVYAAVLVAIGTLAQAAGPAVTVALVPGSGAATFLTIRRLRGPAPRRPLLHLGAVVLVVALAWGGHAVTRGTVSAHVSDASRGGSVLIMSGINSSSGEGAVFELEPEQIGYTCDEFHYFSYAGPGDGQPQGTAACPKREGAPYEPEHTQRPVAEQVSLLVDQAASLEPPVTVIAHSQAAWIAWQAAAEDRLDRVGTLVLVGPFPSSPIGFPPLGQRGAGRVGGELFRLLEPVAHLVDFEFAVDAPLTRELLARPDAASSIFAAPLPDHVQAIALTSTTDLALMPDGWRIDHASNACPIREAHPYLPQSPDLHHVVDRFLGGDPPGDCPPWAELYRVASQAFGSPPHGS